MRIGILAPAGSSHTVKIVNSLSEMGEEVYLYSLPNHRDGDGAIKERVNINYLKFGGGKGYYANALQLSALMKLHKIEVLNAHYVSGYGTLARESRYQPLAVSVWGSDIYDFPQKNIINRKLIEKNLANAKLIMSTSRCMAEETAKYITNKRIVVTPFGVDAGSFVPSPKKNELDDVVRIGIVKSISEPYGIDVLLRAYKIVADSSNKKTELHIYGDGDLLEEMKALSVDLKISDKVFFHGRIKHSGVPIALQSLDIFCAPSLKESFGVSVIEAMATGLPCVTSDAPGLAEVMENGATGFVVTAGNYEGLAEKIILLAGDRKLRRSMGENGRAKVLSSYNWDDNIRLILSELHTICN